MTNRWWATAKAKRVMTTAFTKLPESKGLRGIMELVERLPEKKYGNRLVYAADIRTRHAEPKRIFGDWVRKETKTKKGGTARR